MEPFLDAFERLAKDDATDMIHEAVARLLGLALVQKTPEAAKQTFQTIKPFIQEKPQLFEGLEWIALNECFAILELDPDFEELLVLLFERGSAKEFTILLCESFPAHLKSARARTLHMKLLEWNFSRASVKHRPHLLSTFCPLLRQLVSRQWLSHLNGAEEGAVSVADEGAEAGTGITETIIQKVSNVVREPKSEETKCFDTEFFLQILSFSQAVRKHGLTQAQFQELITPVLLDCLSIAHGQGAGDEGLTNSLVMEVLELGNTAEFLMQHTRNQTYEISDDDENWDELEKKLNEEGENTMGLSEGVELWPRHGVASFLHAHFVRGDVAEGGQTLPLENILPLARDLLKYRRGLPVALELILWAAQGVLLDEDEFLTSIGELFGDLLQMLSIGNPQESCLIEQALQGLVHSLRAECRVNLLQKLLKSCPIKKSKPTLIRILRRTLVAQWPLDGKSEFPGFDEVVSTLIKLFPKDGEQLDLSIVMDVTNLLSLLIMKDKNKRFIKRPTKEEITRSETTSIALGALENPEIPEGILHIAKTSLSALVDKLKSL